MLLYSINRTKFIVWLPLLFEILNNTCIVIVCCLACDVKKFEINLSFFIKLFYITKKLGQKCKYQERDLAINM